MDYLEKARELEKEAEQKAEESVSDEEGPTNREVASLYEQAGKAYFSGGRYEDAVEAYRSSLQFTYDKKRKSLITKRISRARDAEKRELTPKGQKQQRKKKESPLAQLAHRFSTANLVVAALFVVTIGFSAFSLTGNTIGGLNQTYSAMIGIALFVISWIVVFFVIRAKRKKA